MGDDQEITEEQRKLIESKRLAALAKCRARAADLAGNAVHNPWKLFKCVKISPEQNPSTIKPCLPSPVPDPLPKPQKFLARLEICSPDSFSITPLPINGFVYPGEASCFEKLSVSLSNVLVSHYTQNHGGGEASVYKLIYYKAVLKCLKNTEGIEIEEIPQRTFNVVERFSHSFNEGKWSPVRDDFLSDEEVEKLMDQLPKSLLDVLLPFQIEGVRFGLRRGGRCLIADEMGLGKTLQAIAIASCYMEEGSILVICPAILRYSWAEELERWLCLPSDIHLVFCHENDPKHLAKFPKVVVISYKMLHHLQKSLLEQKWAVLIVDESHHVRCAKKRSESGEVQAVLEIAKTIKHIVLLSGTPSLSRHGLLGEDKYAFAESYCAVRRVMGSQQKFFKDYSKGTRLQELNVLLKQTVMIRRLKEHVMMQLPPLRRQVINLVLDKSELDSAKAVCGMANDNAFANTDGEDGLLDVSDEPDGESDDNCCKSSDVNADRAFGIAKLSGFREWLSMHPVLAELEVEESIERSHSSHKMIIFAHFHMVMDQVQEFLIEKGIKYVRIDGHDASAKDRHLAVQSFQYSKEVKIALVGILAGGSGLDLSAAQSVVFLELPRTVSDMQQAESRAHRRGQTMAVNVYIFCAKDTKDESRWKHLNRSLYHVSSMVDGKYDAQHEIEVDRVSSLGTTEEIYTRYNLVSETDICVGDSATELVNSMKSDSGQEMQPDIAFDGIDANANIGLEGKNRSKSHSSHEYNFAKEVDERFHATITLSDREPPNQHEAGSSSSTKANFLRFEVSRYTGRIHLYSCIPGIDDRPTPLFVNFRQEDLEMKDAPAEDSKNGAYQWIQDYQRYMHAVVDFVKEWKRLKAVDRDKLLNKPLQLPLYAELCCLNGSLNHDKGGLLKGRSKRRATPLDEISNPLPPDAIWRKICLNHGKKQREYEQGWTLKDEPLCKLCQKVCKNKDAKVPEFFEDLFCNIDCHKEYRLRTSGRYLREELFRIEHGVCTNCHLNCHKLVKDIRPLSLWKRVEFIRKEAPQLAKRQNLINKLVHDPVEGNAWHADHIVPVYKGGGECDVQNMRTLCVACHADVTAAQCAERRAERAEAKKGLNLAIARHQDSGQSQAIESTIEDDLLINVPGSAYNRADIKGSRNEENEKTSDSQYEDCTSNETLNPN